VFILGIGTHEVLKTKIATPYIWILAAMVFAAYAVQSQMAHRRKKIMHNSMAALFSFLLLGMLSAQIAEYTHKPSISHDEIEKVTWYTLTVKSKPSSTSKTNKYRVVIDRMRLEGKWIHTKAEALLYVHKKMGETLTYGNKLLIKGHPKYLENQKNPYAFDYALFLQRKGIYLQDFLNEGGYVKLPESHGFSLAFMKLQLADYFEKVLEKFIPDDRELNFAKAMLIGRKDDITREMESVYASTGTAHILAVSGLHEGIIYLLVSMLLKGLKNGKLRWLYYGANLCAIWSFAVVTGLSPSAQRAATMLSCIIIGQYSGRKSNIYNSILVSAFILLLFSPNLIFSVSFQLSYAAVFGIVYLYPKLYNLLYVENKILDFFWKITVLSVATQLATFPISIYYFHQFPLLFPFTNLIAIPTATAVISGGLLLLITANLGIVPIVIGKVLSIWIGWYNDLMLWISKIPFHSLTDIHLKVIFVVMIICCIFFFAHFLTTRKLIFFKVFSVVLVVLSLLKGYDYYNYSMQKEVVFYAMKDGTGVDVFYWK
jgi:competence protein ComEC